MEQTEQNQEIIFYEYFINHKTCRVEQRRCIGIKMRENLYRMKFEDKELKRKLVNINEFEIMQLYRIFSFNDDFEHYKQLLVAEYEQTVKRNRTKLERQKQTLEQLKC